MTTTTRISTVLATALAAALAAALLSTAPTVASVPVPGANGVASTRYFDVADLVTQRKERLSLDVRWWLR